MFNNNNKVGLWLNKKAPKMELIYDILYSPTYKQSLNLIKRICQ